VTGAVARFERALAAGLASGQVLRCAAATAGAVDPVAPIAGRYRVAWADGEVVETPDPHLAARLWHVALYGEVYGERD
jgi:hypothetical protein